SAATADRVRALLTHSTLYISRSRVMGPYWRELSAYWEILRGSRPVSTFGKRWIQAPQTSFSSTRHLTQVRALPRMCITAAARGQFRPSSLQLMLGCPIG